MPDEAPSHAPRTDERIPFATLRRENRIDGPPRRTTIRIGFPSEPWGRQNHIQPRKGGEPEPPAAQTLWTGTRLQTASRAISWSCLLLRIKERAKPIRDTVLERHHDVVVSAFHLFLQMVRVQGLVHPQD